MTKNMNVYKIRYTHLATVNIVFFSCIYKLLLYTASIRSLLVCNVPFSKQPINYYYSPRTCYAEVYLLFFFLSTIMIYVCSALDGISVSFQRYTFSLQSGSRYTRVVGDNRQDQRQLIKRYVSLISFRIITEERLFEYAAQ